MNQSVLLWGQKRLDADADRIGAAAAVGLDETLFCREGRYRRKEWRAGIVDVSGGELLADVTYPMLEDARKRLRNLVQLIEYTNKNILYSDFADEFGGARMVDLPGTGGAGGAGDAGGGDGGGVGGDGRDEFAQFRQKAQNFLKENLADDIVAKVRSGEPLTTADMDGLQRVLVAAGIGDDETFAEASQRAGSFGLFIRSLVGLDRAAAKRAFAEFLDDKHYNVDQIRFVEMVIDYLTEHGTIESGRVYESPFTSVAPQGPEALFAEPDQADFFQIIQHLQTTATA